MKKILFIDRDGTIIKEPHDYQIDHIDKFDFVPNAWPRSGASMPCRRILYWVFRKAVFLLTDAAVPTS